MMVKGPLTLFLSFLFWSATAWRLSMTFLFSTMSFATGLMALDTTSTAPLDTFMLSSSGPHTPSSSKPFLRRGYCFVSSCDCSSKCANVKLTSSRNLKGTFCLNFFWYSSAFFLMAGSPAFLSTLSIVSMKVCSEFSKPLKPPWTHCLTPFTTVPIGPAPLSSTDCMAVLLILRQSLKVPASCFMCSGVNKSSLASSKEAWVSIKQKRTSSTFMRSWWTLLCRLPAGSVLPASWLSKKPWKTVMPSLLDL
mmetsp:Transcript_49324/g.127226  ORF Transcript_49324/g.127226 Transcript_49324/m.127226 type:complete len:250 (+) Transcript_49324:736-1485(+)